MVYFVWKRNWWLGKRNLRPEAPADVQRGANAYAERQALIFEGLARKFAKQWESVIKKRGLHQRWPQGIDSALASLSTETQSSTAEVRLPVPTTTNTHARPNTPLAPTDEPGDADALTTVPRSPTPSAASDFADATHATAHTSQSPPSTTHDEVTVERPRSDSGGDSQVIGVDRIVKGKQRATLDEVLEDDDDEISDEESDEEFEGYRGPEIQYDSD